MIEVIKVMTLPNFQLILKFANGEQRCFDMRLFLDYPVFKVLQNPGFFSLAKVDYGTVTWPGDIDIAPETLYAQSFLIDDNEQLKISTGDCSCLIKNL